MPDNATRIEHFRKMAEADPENELGHLNLGRAYLEAGQFDGAIASFQRTIDLNANSARAYQFLGQALLGKGLKDLAIEQLGKGVQVAHTRGDITAKNEIFRMLRELGAPVPELSAAAERAVGEGEVLCNRCGRVGKKLASPPFRNAMGQQIQAKVCHDCWRQWIAMGTKVINELRLPLNDPQAQKVYDQHMTEFLNLQPPSGSEFKL